MSTISHAESAPKAEPHADRLPRIGRPEQYDNLAALARVIRDAAGEVRELALGLGEIGTANEADATRAAWLQIAAVQKTQADEARLSSGELRVRMPNAADLIHDAIESWRTSQTSTASEQLAAAHHAAAVKAGTWARLDAFGDIVNVEPAEVAK